MLGDFMNESKLLADSKASPWKIDKIRGRNKQVRWIPIIDVSGMGFFLGIDEEGKWVADSKDDIIEISSKSSVPLLPALELAYYEFCSKLSECVSKLGLPDSVMSTFPLTDTIRCGLEQVSDYWAESALNWCENYEKTELQRNLKDALEKLFFEKRASQKVRQRAKRLLEKIRKDKLSCIQFLHRQRYPDNYLFEKTY